MKANFWFVQLVHLWCWCKNRKCVGCNWFQNILTWICLLEFSNFAMSIWSMHCCGSWIDTYRVIQVGIYYNIFYIYYSFQLCKFSHHPPTIQYLHSLMALTASDIDTSKTSQHTARLDKIGMALEALRNVIKGNPGEWLRNKKSKKNIKFIAFLITFVYFWLRFERILSHQAKWKVLFPLYIDIRRI